MNRKGYGPTPRNGTQGSGGNRHIKFVKVEDVEGVRYPF